MPPPLPTHRDLPDVSWGGVVYYGPLPSPLDRNQGKIEPSIHTLCVAHQTQQPITWSQLACRPLCGSLAMTSFPQGSNSPVECGSIFWGSCGNVCPNGGKRKKRNKRRNLLTDKMKPAAVGRPSGDRDSQPGFPVHPHTPSSLPLTAIAMAEWHIPSMSQARPNPCSFSFPPLQYKIFTIFFIKKKKKNGTRRSG